MFMKWKMGAPTEQGLYWVATNLVVQPVMVFCAYGNKLYMLVTGSGVTVSMEHVLYHAKLELPSIENLEIK